MTHLLIRLLGPFEVTSDGEPATGFRSDKTRALLAYLCVEAQRPHRRERLAGLLWPDLPESSARANLRRELANLRQVLSPPAQGETATNITPPLDITRQTIQFSVSGDVWVDAPGFVASIEGPQHSLERLEAAMGLYRGELLEGFSLPDSALFEEWLLLQRERFGRLALNVLHQLAEAYRLQGKYERALGYAWRQAALDPLREQAHRQVMRLLAHAGRAGEALAQYETCCRILDEELGTEPSAATTHLCEQIRDQTLPRPPPSPVRLPAFLTEEQPAGIAPPNFVAREGELARLGDLLDRSCQGQGATVLVVGEAGSGKTALLQEFGRRAAQTHPGLLVTAGKGNTYTGTGDPYLPFRQALGLLTGDVEGPWLAGVLDTSQALHLWRALPAAVQALAEVGPDLVGPLVAGTSLLERARAFLRWSGAVAPGWATALEALTARPVAPPGAPGPDQRDLFEQVTQVLHKIARPGGLVLMLDDFQWADSGSIGLLFHLGRRLAGSRILIALAYRPEEVALSHGDERHPLAPVVHQLQREFGDVEVDLDRAAGRPLVDAFLDSEPNRLGPDFRDRLYGQTAGHPLFTIELLRSMQERGDLVHDPEEGWVEGPALDWRAMPTRTEAVIAERIGRLDPASQRTLQIASVLGEEFTAEAVAHVQGTDEEALLRRLSRELGRQHRLVDARGIERAGTQRLSLYRFRHILFQRWLYHDLDEVERAHLHGQAGRALEVLYGDHPEALAEITPQLARHFERAGLADRAVTYLHQAGARALRMWANEEAIQHLTAGLALLECLPETGERHRQELSMQLALRMPLQALKGYAAPETGRAYARARELALHTDIGEPAQQMQILGLLGSYFSMRAEHHKSLELYERSLALARQEGERPWEAVSHLRVGMVLIFAGDLCRAVPHLEETTGFYDPEQHRSLALAVGQDVGVSAHAWAAWARWFLGYPDQALAHSQTALTLAESSEHPFSLCFAHYIAGLRLRLLRGELPQARRHLEAMRSLATAGHFVLYEAGATICGGWLLAEQGEVEAGIAQIHEGLAAWEQTGAEMDKPYHLGLLAEAYGRAGEVEQGLEQVVQALEIVDRSGERFYEAELYRLQGHLLAQSATFDEAKVEVCYRRAADVARLQSARVLELRAATSLAHLWHTQGKAEEARQVLTPVYDWFTEGFDTRDLRQAEAFLAAPASPPSSTTPYDYASGAR